MKHYANSFSIAILALVITGCSTNNPLDITEERLPVDGIHSFAATSDAPSRAGISGTKSAWDTDDAVSVVDYPSEAIIRANIRNSSISSDHTNAIFDCETALSSSTEKYAVYPCFASATDVVLGGTSSSRTMTFTLPTQNTGETFRYPLLLASWTDANKTFAFRNPLAVLKITLCKAVGITEKVCLNSITITGNNNESMWGEVVATMPAATIAPTSAASKSVVATCAGREITADGTAFYVCILPQNYTKGLTFSFDTDHGTFTRNVRTSGLDYSAKANHVITLPPLEYSDDNSGIHVAILRATDTTIAVEWTVTPANASLIGGLESPSYDITTDIAKKYKVELYRNANCTDMVVGWTLNDTSDNVSTVRFTTGKPPRFTFTNLLPQTTYYLIVRNLTDNVSMRRPMAISTIAPAYTGTVATANAAVGETILFESFDKVYLGGDLAMIAAGYSRQDRSSLTSLATGTATGDNPDKADSQFYSVDCSTEIGLFNTLKGIVSDMGLSNWAWIADDNKTGCILSRTGYLKIGASSKHASIITPELTALRQMADVRVRFKACPYGSSTSYDESEKPIVVKVFNDVTVNSSYLATQYTTADFVELTLEGDQHTWKEYSVVLHNVNPTSRIGFGGNKAGTGVQSRFYIDDIRVEVVKYVEASINGTFSDTSGNPIAGVVVTDGFSVVRTDDDGYYSMPINDKAEFVYYTVPAEYEVNYNDKGFSTIYAPIENGKTTYNFTLAPLPGGKQTRWTLCTLADPQTKSLKCIDRFLAETAPDMKQTLAKYNNVYSVCLGDVLWNSTKTMWLNMYAAMAYENCGAHFFAVMGNHDWYSSDTDTAPSDARFKSYFGPTRYSFDRGDVHVVCMNNVIANGKGGECSAGFTDDEYNWLVKDLATVPTSKCVVLCCHVPFRNGKEGTYHSEYYSETRTALAKFAKAYIMIGHSHFNYHYFHAVSGKTIKEIIHTAACGLFWQVKCCGDGSPAGYGIYEFDGADIANSRIKCCGYDEDYQIRAYDGSEVQTGQYVDPYSWQYDKGYIVANVFNADQNWKVQLYQNGTLVGNMTRITSNDTRTPTTLNITSVTTSNIGNDRDWWLWYQVVDPHSDKKDRDGYTWGGRRSDSSYQKTTNHLYKCKLRTVPSDMSTANFEVRATDPHGNVYSCTKLSHYSERDAWR